MEIFRMMTIRLFGLIAGLILVYFTFISYKRKSISMSGFIAWSALWLILATLSVISNLLKPLLEFLNVTRALDLLFIISIAMILIIQFNQSIKIRKNEKRTEKIIQDNALESQTTNHPLFQKK